MTATFAFQPGEEGAGLEPLGRRRGSRGIGTPMRAIFDVLYELGEPLDVDALAQRTFERVDAPAHYHARRAYVRDLISRRSVRQGSSEAPRNGTDVSLERAWKWHIKTLTRFAASRGVLIRSEGPCYEPNPAKPPRVQQPDGRVVPYTREQALGLGALEQAIGDIQAMRPELGRLLAGLDQDELRQAVELAAVAFAPRSGERTDPRTLRARLRWLLGRPSTDAGRAWLLGELVRRAYGDPPA